MNFLRIQRFAYSKRLRLPHHTRAQTGSTGREHRKGASRDHKQGAQARSTSKVWKGKAHRP
jgi:hypothetical protein